MGNLRIVWKKRALRDLGAVADWYRVNLGYSSTQKVIRSAYEAVFLLSAQPGIGIIQSELSGVRYQYRGYLMHPYYK